MSETDQIDSNPAAVMADPTPSAPSDDVAALMAKLESADRHIAKLNKESQKHREAKEAHKARLAEQGEYKALADERGGELEEARAQIAELSAYAEKAKAYDALVAAETEALFSAAAEAPEHIRLAIESVPDLATKKKILEGHRASSSQEVIQNQTKPPHPGPNPVSGNFDESTPEGRKKFRESLQSGRRSSYAPR